ncbi:hypothetical protein P170DRAFT_441167 [Aspergillus steynii IBT 23096]|uniref:Uncharacterized protein n=1 Tax=Aspergillus steynii IBT 23096 TaxID=1392250 RepID=A0A2I2FSZ1_9EURO|nr:uncharacterized protein P170DRAFT_441167 [Aspergillus steynii IBT 23096]PLB43707.1 hypothetical protein P170DRAFT_441167 [Aspergillus steynii IBT 23096]
MQFNLIVATVAALASVGIALPTGGAAGPHREAQIEVPENNTTTHAPMRHWPKIMSPNSGNGEVRHGSNADQSLDPRIDRCPSICAVAAQACVVAIGCTDRC